MSEIVRVPYLGLTYPKLEIPGIPEERVGELYNTKHYHYFLKKVKNIRSKACPFCVIDESQNVVFFETADWRVWENTMAPEDGTRNQLLIASVRHFDKRTDMTHEEWVGLRIFLLEMYKQPYCVQHNLTDDNSVIIRSGHPANNAKSVPHYHENILFPNGSKKITPTVGKAQSDVDAKTPLIRVWIKMLSFPNNEPEQDWEKILSPDEWNLTKGKIIDPPKAA